MKPMTLRAYLDAVEQRAQAATPGEWYWWMSEAPPFKLGTNENVDIKISMGSTNDAEFVATSKRDVLRLVTLLRRAVEALERLEAITDGRRADDFEDDFAAVAAMHRICNQALADLDAEGEK